MFDWSIFAKSAFGKLLSGSERTRSGQPRERELPLPEIFEIEPINTCNLRCTMCHVSFMKHDDVRVFDLGLFRRLNSLRGKWATVGSNFEPTMHPQFATIVKTLTDMGCKMDLTTNGTLLRQAVSREIADSSIENVTVSFDGIRKETFEKIRRRARIESALERILYFREVLKPKNTFFAVNSVLMRINIDELVEMVDFWNNHDFHQLRFIFMVIRSLDRDAFGENDLVRESLYPVREYAYAKLEEAARHLVDAKLKITLSCPYFKWSDVRKTYPGNVQENLVISDNPESRRYFNPRQFYQAGPYPGMKVDCRSPFRFARILFNGDVQLCYKYVVGNLNDQDFEDIWYGEKATRVRQTVMASPKICHSCDFYRFCLGSGKIDVNDKINYFAETLIGKSKHVDFNVAYR